MKKYIMTISAITFFLGSQIVSMDRNPSAENIRSFKNFLASKLATIQSSLLIYRGNQQIPMLHTALLINWQTHMRDMAAKHHIDRSTAENIFRSLTRETVIRHLSLIYPEQNAAAIQEFYDTYYGDSVGILAHHIFN